MFDDEMYSVWVGFNIRIGIYPQSSSTLYYPNVRKSQKAALNFAKKTEDTLLQDYGYNFIIQEDLRVSAMDDVRIYDVVATKSEIDSIADTDNVHLIIACGLDFDLKEYVRRTYSINL